MHNGMSGLDIRATRFMYQGGKMRFALFLLSILALHSIDACVTVNQSKGTYTISPSGCVGTK